MISYSIHVFGVVLFLLSNANSQNAPIAFEVSLSMELYLYLLHEES